MITTTKGIMAMITRVANAPVISMHALAMEVLTKGMISQYGLLVVDTSNLYSGWTSP